MHLRHECSKLEQNISFYLFDIFSKLVGESVCQEFFLVLVEFYILQVPELGSIRTLINLELGKLFIESPKRKDKLQISLLENLTHLTAEVDVYGQRYGQKHVRLFYNPASFYNYLIHFLSIHHSVLGLFEVAFLLVTLYSFMQLQIQNDH